MILNFTASDDYPIRPYIVELADLYDDDVRKLIRLYAIGEADVRSQVREKFPSYFVRGIERGYFVRDIEPLCVCEHRLHAGPCRGGASTSEGRFVACGCGA